MTYEMKGGSGASTFSGFCPTCGSQVTRASLRMQDLVYVHAGTLDEPSLYTPSRSIFAASAQPWDNAVIMPET